MSEDRIKLTIKDRIILANQYRMLEALYPDEAKCFEEMRTIVESGYELHYSDICSSIDERTLTEEQCREVMNILDMYRALKYSYNALKDKSGISAKDVQFEGFDGNEESQIWGYAMFLVLKQGRWQEILEGRPGFGLNSHFPVIDMYRRVLDEWNKISIEKKFELPRDEIKRILDARIHPERRK